MAPSQSIRLEIPLQLPYLCRVLLAIFLALAPTFKPHPHKAHPPAEDPAQQAWYFVEDHADVIYPVVALIVAGLIFLGVRRGMRSNVDELRQQQDQKDRIVRMMRSKLLVTPEDAAGELQIDRFRAGALLEELVTEGKLVHQRMGGGVQSYRLKGL
jgi:hypothetical protein